MPVEISLALKSIIIIISLVMFSLESFMNRVFQFDLRFFIIQGEYFVSYVSQFASPKQNS